MSLCQNPSSTDKRFIRTLRMRNRVVALLAVPYIGPMRQLGCLSYAEVTGELFSTKHNLKFPISGIITHSFWSSRKHLSSHETFNHVHFYPLPHQISREKQKRINGSRIIRLYKTPSPFFHGAWPITDHPYPPFSPSSVTTPWHTRRDC